MKTITLLSGGIDSALTAYLAREDSEIICLNIDYGQSMEEVQAMFGIADWLKARLLFSEISIPESSDPDKTNFIPVRNQILLSIALAYAIKENCQQIAVGFNIEDFNDYVDCRPEWIKDFVKLGGVYLPSLEIYHPLISLTKKDVIAYAIHKGIPLEQTRSCYVPINGLSCGKCNACKLRLSAFSELGLEDPIAYV